MNDFDAVADDLARQRPAGHQAAPAAIAAACLDVEAGLKEILLASKYTSLGRDVGAVLDVAAGLEGIMSSINGQTSDYIRRPIPERSEPNAEATMGLTGSAVGDLLWSLDVRTRLAVRALPAFDAFAAAVHCARADLHAHILAARTGDPERERADARALVRALVCAVDCARAVDRDLARDMGEALDCAREVDRSFAHTVAWATALVLGRGRALVKSLANLLDCLLDYARELACELVHDCPVSIDLANALDRDIDRALDVAQALDPADALSRARHDFTGADLRDVDLHGVSLVGLRWSMATQWPSSEWKTQAMLDSVEVEPGTFVIRGGTTTASTVVK